MVEMKNACKSLVVKAHREKTTQNTYTQTEINVKMDIKEMGFESVDCTHLAQDRY
jgi:hypothetical protein